MAMILLPPALSADRAEALKTQLLQAIGDGGVITLDGGRVVSLSTPCLQVLLAAAAAAAKVGKPLILREPSAELLAALADLGLGSAAPWEIQG
jgi:chemotaxis protein CheX